MTDEHTRLVQASFAQMAPIAASAASLFYARLFELDPRLQSLFTGDLQAQGRKLMQTLGVAVQSLDCPARLSPALEALGRRHVAYGVADADYATVAAALVWMLEQTLGTACTPAVREAWTATYWQLASVMRDASSVPASVV